MDLLNKFQLKYLINQALRSEEKFKHGAIILDKKGNIISSGFNHKVDYYNHKFTIHAEIDAINKIIKNQYDLNNILIVIRINKNNELKMSKPCKDCEKYIVMNKIRKVYYSSE